ncbi:hypothetical protein O181_010737 [Austropuccinia psidii MF-1]|uniref:Uncharacterized protein n=1 Tax=Austropuccinia psidii MF-1 TaxID=1389203 RepID=A0A9Q3BT87_9BASI|nr:hypothetical protein [Austropuccinia psidii MF-1]
MEMKNMRLLTEEWSKNSPPPPKQVQKTDPVPRSRNSNVKKQPQGQRQDTSHENLHPGLQNPKHSAGCHGECISGGQNNDGITEKGGSQIQKLEIIFDILDGIPNWYIAINDVKTHIYDKNSSICNNLKTNNSSLNQTNETIMCLENVLRAIKTSNNDNSFGNKLNEQSAVIRELTDKYSEFNIDEIIETRIKQAISTIKKDNKNVLENISKSFTEITSDNTRQTELWQELKQTEDNHKANAINLLRSLQHEFRNSQRCNNSTMNDIEQLLHTLPRMSTPLNQN